MKAKTSKTGVAREKGASLDEQNTDLRYKNSELEIRLKSAMIDNGNNYARAENLSEILQMLGELEQRRRSERVNRFADGLDNELPF